MRRRRAAIAGAGIALVVVAIFVTGIAPHHGRGSHAARSSGPAPAQQTARPAQQTASPAQQAALPAPVGEQFGASVNRLFNDPIGSPAQIAGQLAALRAAGATVARSDALWEATEPRAPTAGTHHWVWTFDDTIAAALAVAGLRWLPILDYSAPWAQSIRGQDHSAPRSAADYAAYAGAFAARYGSAGTFWRSHPQLPAVPVDTIEIWNEPDNGEFWTPVPNAAGYARLYLAARAAIDAADPGTRVLVGGLTDPSGFLPAMVRASPALAGHVDGVAIHPYGTPPVALSKVRAARSALDAVGMGAVPLYVTEVGWTTSPPGALDYVPPARRPAFIRRTVSTFGHLACGLAATILYTWVTPQRDPADSQDWFGIHDVSGGATPSSAAFAAGLVAARAPTRTIPCSG